tara:strand:+ start:266 stop:568 length:303 start_codon:yes stop_codon:yes gene_type:complete
MSKSKNTDLAYKLGESIKIAESLAREIEQLRWETGSTLVDLREENEQLRVQFDNIKRLSQNLVDRYYSTESDHYDEYEDDNKPQDHAFLVIKELNNLLNQ